MDVKPAQDRWSLIEDRVLIIIGGGSIKPKPNRKIKQSKSERTGVGQRYKMLDDAIFAVYGLRKKSDQKTIDFIKNTILPIDDAYRFELFLNELGRIKKKVCDK